MGPHLFYGMDHMRHENYNITFLYMVCIGPDCNLDTSFCDIYDFRFIMPVERIRAYDIRDFPMINNVREICSKEGIGLNKE